MSPFERFVRQCVRQTAVELGPSIFEQFIRQHLAKRSDSKSLLTLDDMRIYQTFLADLVAGLPDQNKFEGYLMTVPMGMGKTAATLTGIARILEKRPDWRFIIIAPLEVAKNTWPDEIEAWEHLRHLTYSVCVGTAEERAAALKPDSQILIINRDNLQWLWEKIRGAIGWRWHMMIYDESSRLKGFTTRTPAFKYKDGKKIKVKQNLSEFGVVAQARSIVKRVVELTGTPAGNGVIDLGGQIKIIDNGKRLGENKSKFHKRFFIKNEFNHSIKPKPGARDEIMGLVKDVMIGLRAEDHITLPKRMFNEIKVKLPPPLMKQYRKFERDMVSVPYDVEAVNRGVLSNKLLQFASGGLYRKDPDLPEAPRETVPVHDLKLKALDNILEEAAGEHVLVAYNFQFDKARLKKRYKKMVFFDETPNFVKMWNNGEIEWGASHPASIGHGLNLQWGGHIQAWFSPIWSREIWDQFNWRLARTGQTETVMIHYIVAEGTEDEEVMLSLDINGAEQDAINAAVHVRI